MAMLLITHDLGIVGLGLRARLRDVCRAGCRMGAHGAYSRTGASLHRGAVSGGPRRRATRKGVSRPIDGDPPILARWPAALCSPLPEGAARMRALDAGRIRLGRRRIARRALLALFAGARAPRPLPIVRVEARMAAPLLALQGITHSFRRSGGALVTAVRDVSLEVGRGETVALVGELGSGKSTLGTHRARLCSARCRPRAHRRQKPRRHVEPGIAPRTRRVPADLPGCDRLVQPAPDRARFAGPGITAAGRRHDRPGGASGLLESVGLRPGRAISSATRMS